jgi:hypothetical protein
MSPDDSAHNVCHESSRDRSYCATFGTNSSSDVPSRRVNGVKPVKKQSLNRLGRKATLYADFRDVCSQEEEETVSKRCPY